MNAQGKMSGIGCVQKDPREGFLYTELVHLTLGNGFSSDATQVLRFVQIQDVISLYFETPMRQGQLFCTLSKKDDRWMGTYYCGNDTYTIFYVFHNHDMLTSLCLINGPKKNIDIETCFKRAVF